MAAIPSRTLRTSVRRTGRGLHTAAPCEVWLEPAAFGDGVVFEVDGVRVPARRDYARAMAGATLLTRGETVVGTPEHLMAALRGLGITDARVLLMGPELPALDGSARLWVGAIDAAGIQEGPPIAPMVVEPLQLEAHGGRVRVEPGPFSVTVVVDFPGGPRGEATWEGDPERFRLDVAWARTFVLAADVEALRAAGRGQGATSENTLVVGEGIPRRDDEPVQHKLLDAIGDLALLPPFEGRVHIERGSHRLHIEALRELVLHKP